MKKYLLPFLALSVVALIVFVIFFSSRTGTQPSSVNSSVPKFDHIVVIVMENKTEQNIIGNKDAPYINSLAGAGALAANYSAVGSPSLPNYLALLGGSTFGVTSDCTDCFQNSANLVDQLEQNHRTWKAYMESMPSPCFLGDSNPYAQKHNPFIYFDDIKNNSDRCNNIVPMDGLTSDLATTSFTPDFIWISPNLCNDMHDCPVPQGDTWLSQQIPGILESPAFKLQKSLLVLTWDEGNSSDKKVATILVGAGVKGGFVSNTSYTHYSLLKTIEASWNLLPLTANDQKAIPLSDFFQ